MLLCDVGNTSYHFYDGKKSYKKAANSFDPATVQEEVFYICVNPHAKTLLATLENWRDLSWHVERTNYYDTMGIDRIVACETLENGIIIDAGSAITVDVVREGIFQGGFIYPGMSAMGQAYKNISTALDYSFNFELDLDKIPKNSRDAISYGYLKTLFCEVMSHKMDIFLTGGDAKVFATLFVHAKIDEMLIFKGMKKIMKKAELC